MRSPCVRVCVCVCVCACLRVLGVSVRVERYGEMSRVWGVRVCKAKGSSRCDVKTSTSTLHVVPSRQTRCPCTFTCSASTCTSTNAPASYEPSRPMRAKDSDPNMVISHNTWDNLIAETSDQATL